MTRQNLESVLAGLGPVAVAVSGGVDSLTLATLAHRLAPGATLVKLFGRPATEDEEYAARAAKVRDIGVSIAVQRAIFMVGLMLLASLATAMVYGVGGIMAVNGTLTIGTLLALAALLGRLYGPLTALSNVRVDVMTALVSFERVFEILDLEPLVKEAEHPRALPDGALDVELDDVSFSYPDGPVVLADVDVVDEEARVGLARRSEVGLDAAVQLPVPRLEPRSTAGREDPRLGDLRHAEEVTVEGPQRVLAACGTGDLDVVQPEDAHALRPTAKTRRKARRTPAGVRG